MVRDFLGYQVVALVLLMLVSLMAMLFDIVPVLLASALSALIWNFFFIPPQFTFHIDKAEDLLMFMMYFFIASVNAVLTFKIRKEEKKVRSKEEKEKTIRLYNTLLNSLSHELRTPVSTILGAVDILKDNSPSISPENKSSLLIEIDKAGSRLNRQIENLLNMSRLESGTIRLHLDWCDVNELIHRVVQNVQPDSGHRIIVEIEEQLPLFKLDAGLLEQVIMNIIHNALQYTPDGTLINVQAIHRDGICLLSISDNGQGFPPNEIDRVFEKFYRLTDSSTGGTGLGLSIAKGFVDAHGGSIKLENQTNRGALFTISIPAETSFMNYLKNE